MYTLKKGIQMAQRDERLYKIYNSIRFRAGHNDIELDAAWAVGYEAFTAWSKLNGYSETCNLYRIDVNIGYTQQNCKWAEHVSLIRPKADQRKKHKCKSIACDNLTARRDSHCRTCSAKLRTTSNLSKSDYARNWSLKKKYGITLSDFYEKLNNQNGKCAICTKLLELPTEGQGQGLNVAAVDHCHVTGKVRDIICNACNKALGLFNDDTTLLFNAITYLRKHNDQ